MCQTEYSMESKEGRVSLDILKEVGQIVTHKNWLLSTGDKALVYCVKYKYFGAGITRRMCLLIHLLSSWVEMSMGKHGRK